MANIRSNWKNEGTHVCVINVILKWGKNIYTKASEQLSLVCFPYLSTTFFFQFLLFCFHSEAFSYWSAFFVLYKEHFLWKSAEKNVPRKSHMKEMNLVVDESRKQVQVLITVSWNGSSFAFDCCYIIDSELHILIPSLRNVCERAEAFHYHHHLRIRKIWFS